MKRWAPALLLTACSATIPGVHARAVSTHMQGLSTEAHRVAQDARAHPRCWEGVDPVTHRAHDLDQRLVELAGTAERHEDGSWPTQDAFQEALADAQSAQTELALLRAEYDACRAHSATPTDVEGIRLAPGARRVALVSLQDPNGVLSAPDRERVDVYLQAKLSSMFALVPREVVRDAELDHVRKEGCLADCAFGLAREVGAHKTLVVTVHQKELECAVSLALLDLQSGVTERARAVRSDDCALESVVSGIEDAIAPLEGG